MTRLPLPPDAGPRLSRLVWFSLACGAFAFVLLVIFVEFVR